MKTTALLRVASFIALLFALGHTMGSPWTPGPASVVAAMKSLSFDAMGSNRTYWDFYFGFGVSISVYMFALAALLWFVASLARTQAVDVRPFIVVFLACYAANGYVAWRHFFVLPLALSVAIVICLGFALVSAKPRVDD